MNIIGKSDAEPNRLAHEKSPYLLQHAYNPVDWFPWGDEAFDKATREDKPIFLSIGYSTCHWCHVMERESFEDPEAAKLLNEVFVPIKVDREERPDIDHIYMTVCQLMTGAGGWPLNVVMTPDKRPFFAGTYFPKVTRYGRIGVMDLAARVDEIWRTRRSDVMQSADQVMNALRNLPEDAPDALPGKDTAEKAFQELSVRFDPIMGGFGPAPKFPTPHTLLFLLRYWKRTGDDHALDMVKKTLTHMRRGGIFDHVGFGFHRYSTDAEWLVPHFEKMLYDQALLAMAYTEGFQATGAREFADTAQQIFTYVLRDMVSPEGAFYSAEDADSEGEEGKFYLWSVTELVDTLGEKEGRFVSDAFGFQFGGNFKDEASGVRTGANIAHFAEPTEEIASRMNMEHGAFLHRLDLAREKLFEAREKRQRPHKDDKALTDWNGLMIAALAKAGQVFGREDYVEAAAKSADFILTTMLDGDGRLLHRFRDGDAALGANIDDYAFFVWGLTELYQASFQVKYLRHAVSLSRKMKELFEDPAVGGFFFTPEHAADLIVRKKEVYDGATPSGNSVAALNLLRLARITGDHELEQLAETVMRAFSGNVKQSASAHTMMMSAVEFILGPAHEVVIVGTRGSSDTERLLRDLRGAYAPHTVTVFKPEERPDEIESLVEFVKHYSIIDGRAAAFVCSRHTCREPVTDSEKMLELLNG